jgi:DNA-binding winged helix-turn-helix (wHTH) protein/Tol biopolymer transport system component
VTATSNERFPLVLQIGDLRVETGTATVSRAGECLPLPKRSFDLLLALARAAPNLVAIDELMSSVWPGLVVEGDTVSQRVKLLRHALGDDPRQPRYIGVVRGRGYRLVCPVTRVATTSNGPDTEAASVAASRSEPIAMPQSLASEPAFPFANMRRSPLHAWWTAAAAALAALTIGSIAVIAAWRRPSEITSPDDWVALTDVADSATAPALSPDGRQLAFIRNGSAFLSSGQIWLKALPDGEPVQLTHESHAIFAPSFTSDGSRVAYSVVAFDHPSTSWDTWTVPVTVGPPERLLPNASGLTFIGPHEVMYSEFKTGIHLGLATSLEDRARHRDIYWPAHERGMAHYSHLSPDRRSVLVVEMQGDGHFHRCRLVPFDGRTQGTPVGPDGSCHSAAWSPDGRWMYFAVETAKGTHLWRQQYPDGKPQQITNGPGNQETVLATPDGKALLSAVGLEQGELWMHDAQGERRLTSEGLVRSPWLSDDGRRVYYLTERRPGDARLNTVRRIDVDTGRSSEVLSGFDVRNFDVSADEQWIAFASTSGDVSSIWVAPLDRSASPKRLSPDGDEVRFDRERRVYFRKVGSRLNYLQRTDLDGTKPERVSETPIREFLSIAPNGGFALVTGTLAEFNGEFLMPLSEGSPVKIAGGLWPGQWSRDGKALYIEVGLDEQSGHPGRTRVVPLDADGLPVGTLHPQPVDVTLINHEEELMSFAKDLDAYAFVKRRATRNIYRIPLH